MIKFCYGVLFGYWSSAWWIIIFLIRLDGGSVALFMTIKMGFLWVIAGIILKLYEYKKKYAYAAIGVLSLLQLILIFFFLLG